MSVAENKAVVQQFLGNFEKVRATRDLSLLENYMPSDVVLKLTGFPPEMQGLEAFGQGLLMFITAFPDLQIIDCQPMVAEADRVAVRVSWTGTHLGDFMGIPPTGKRVSVVDMHYERVVDGKIVEHSGVTDSMSLLQQIGVIPSPQ